MPEDIIVDIDDELAARLTVLAQQHGMTVDQYASKVVAEYIAELMAGGSPPGS